MKLSSVFHCKKVLWAFIIMALLACGTVENVASATSNTYFYVDPAEVKRVDPSGNFLIKVNVTGARPTYAWEISLSWDPNLLKLTSVSEGDFLNRGLVWDDWDQMWVPMYTTTFVYTSLDEANLNGQIKVGCSLIGEVPWASGNGGLCSFDFTVEARGLCSLNLLDTDTKLFDHFWAGSPASTNYPNVDGFFDNRILGHLAAPLYKNVALKPGDEFDIVITAEKVLYPTSSVSFFLDHDANVLEGPSYVEVTDLSLVTEDPVPLATIHFKLKAEGWTVLHIRDINAVSIYGDALYFDSSDGSFASVNPIDLTRRGAWPDTMLPMYGTIDTLHAQVATTGTGAPVAFQVVFTIYDLKGGFPLGTIMTAPATMPPPTTMEVTGPFDTKAWGTPKYYWFIGFYMVKVRAQVTYDSNGDGIMDSFGSRARDFYILVLAFKW